MAVVDCPGCGLEFPEDPLAAYDGYYNTGPECWSVYGEVLAFQYGNVPVWGLANQPVVDTCAVQHAGGGHPDKSVDVHLSGLHLALQRDIAPSRIPNMLQRLAASTRAWPHFSPPEARAGMTVADVAMAINPVDHVERVLRWANEVWELWSVHHDAVAEFVSERVPTGP